MNSKQIKEYLKLFKAGILEAAALYDREPYEVTAAQFSMTKKISEFRLRRLGGFGALKSYSFPAPDGVQDSGIKMLIQKLSKLGK